MRFSPSNPLDVQKSRVLLEKLIAGKNDFEITEKKGRKMSEEELRTLQQNKTIHMWFSCISDELGFVSREECKRDIKRTLLGMKPCVNRFTGECGYEDYKTSDMSVSELSSFMEKLKIWAEQDLGIYLPMWSDPGYEQMVQIYKNK